MHTGQIEREGDGEEGHGRGHRQPGLEQDAVQPSPVEGGRLLRARMEGHNPARPELHGRSGLRRRGEGLRLEALRRKAGQRKRKFPWKRLGGCVDACARSLGQDPLQQLGRGFRPRRLQHLQPGCTAAGVGQQRRAAVAAGNMPVEGCLVGLREQTVHGVGQQRFRVQAVRPGAAVRVELNRIGHLNHLSFHTL